MESEQGTSNNACFCSVPARRRAWPRPFSAVVWARQTSSGRCRPG